MAEKHIIAKEGIYEELPNAPSSKEIEMAREYEYKIPRIGIVGEVGIEVEAVLAQYAIAERLETLVEVVDKIREALIKLQRR